MLDIIEQFIHNTLLISMFILLIKIIMTMIVMDNSAE